MVASPMTSYQDATGSWLAIMVDLRPCRLHIPLYIRSRFPVISVHCLFKNGIVNVKLILFSQTLSFQLESDRFMHNPVEACLCNQFISNHVIPVGNRKLTRDYQ